MKKLLSVKRLSVDVYVKLEALREEDDSHNHVNFLKQSKKAEIEEQNFFLENEELAKDVKGFEDVTMDEDGDILEDRQARYEQDCEKGFFLQPIYV